MYQMMILTCRGQMGKSMRATTAAMPRVRIRLSFFFGGSVVHIMNPFICTIFSLLGSKCLGHFFLASSV